MLQRILELPEETLDRYDTSSLRIIAGERLRAAGPARHARDGPLRRRALQPLRLDRGRMGDDRHAGRPARRARHRRQTAARHDREAVRRKRPRGRRPARPGRIFVASGLPFEGYTGGDTKATIGELMSSGDVGHFDGAGRLFIDGRDDDMIVSGGENVFPAEVEDLLASHPAVREVAVIGVEDEDWGQRLKAVVVLARRRGHRRGRAEGPRQAEPRRVQGPARGRVRRRAAAQRDGQGVEAESGVADAPRYIARHGPARRHLRPRRPAAERRRGPLDRARAADRAVRAGRPALRREPVAGPAAARRLAHDAQRLGAASALRGRARGAVHALPGAGGAALRRSTRGRSTSRAAARSWRART